MNSTLDLRQLSVRRDAPAVPARRRNKHVLTRYALPGAVVLGFVGLLTLAVGDQFLPARSVTVVPVLSTRSEVRNEGAPLFQSAGWIEPRPTPTLVTALAEGVVDKLFVVEGQKVNAGEVVACLVVADAELAVQAAEADLELRMADLNNAKATAKGARANLEKPGHLQAALGEADAALAQKETELAGLPFQLTSAKARLELARQSYEGKHAAADVVPGFAIQQAKSEMDIAASAVAELESRDTKLKREVEAQRQKRDALNERLTLKTDEVRHLGEAESNVNSAEARIKQAQVALATAKLRAARMTITATVDGHVLALAARPGMRVMGLAPGSLHDSSTIVSLYDPAMLQVRADVRLEDVSRVQPGQKVKIQSAAAPGNALDGEVLQITSQADVQKNTLQVKVAIHNPPPSLRPEMLAQVTFLAPPSPKSKETDSQPLRLLVPRQLVESGDGGTRVWIADLAAKKARAKTVKLGQAAGDLVEVLEGLNLADRVISGGRDGLKDGQRITVTSEDGTLGVVTNSATPRTNAKSAVESGTKHAGKH